MQARLLTGDPLAHDTPLVAVGVFQGDAPLEGLAARLDEAAGGALGHAREAGDFRGREEDALLLYLPEGPGPGRVLFLGAGDPEKADAEALRKLAARAVRQAEARSILSLTVHVPEGAVPGTERAVQACAEGALLAAWDFRELRSPTAEGTDETPPPPLLEEVTLHSGADRKAAERGLRVGAAFSEGANLARTLQWRPGNVATPSHLAEVAEELARRHGFGIRILGPEELRSEGMEALLAVSAGSDQAPRLIVLEHRGGVEGDRPLALVGKGLTFDAGGISIKPARGMEDMKYDMSGGAAVLGAMKAIGTLDLPVNAVGVVPSAENLLSGKATKPGDVIRTRAGKTVEVINTDAEGRLILADALSYVMDHHGPAAVVDCATLTGACVIALGHHAAAVLGSDEALVEQVRAAGDRAGERCWPLPLWEAYRRQLDSTVADLKNVGGRPAGAITAAWFLREFVGDVPWAHLDVAGTAYGEPRAPYQRKGGFGAPTRLLLEWVQDRSR